MNGLSTRAALRKATSSPDSPNTKIKIFVWGGGGGGGMRLLNPRECGLSLLARSPPHTYLDGCLRTHLWRIHTCFCIRSEWAEGREQRIDKFAKKKQKKKRA